MQREYTSVAHLVYGGRQKLPLMFEIFYSTNNMLLYEQ